MSSQRTLGNNTREQADSLGKLSSGNRINKAADDAAGLAISEKLRAKIRGSAQAERNANDGISLIQTAEGGLNEIAGIVARLRELAIQSASDTIGDDERGFANLEFQSLKQEIERISSVTEFNGKRLLNGEGETYDFQIGINNNPIEDRISYPSGLLNSKLTSLKIDGNSIESKETARTGILPLDEAISAISRQRAQLGAFQNRLGSTIQNLQISQETQSAANSRIRDTEFASETARNAKQTILTAAGTSVLSQANNFGSGVMKLLG